MDNTTLADELEVAYDRCKLWPEDTGDGFMALLELRNLTPAILAALRTPAPAPVVGGREYWESQYVGKMTEQKVEALARSMCSDPTVMAPVQGYPGGIPWVMHMQAYEAYCVKWSKQVALIDLFGRGCRGGFSVKELDDFIPGWREQLSERTALLAKIAELEAALQAQPTASAAQPVSGDPFDPETDGTDCPSCGGQNTSCPDGCGREPETGELNGTRLETAQPDEVVEAMARAISEAGDCPRESNQTVAGAWWWDTRYDHPGNEFAHECRANDIKLARARAAMQQAPVADDVGERS